MFCDKCGAGLQVDQRFCSRCGKQVAGPSWDIRSAIGCASMFAFSESFGWHCPRSTA